MREEIIQMIDNCNDESVLKYILQLLKDIQTRENNKN